MPWPVPLNDFVGGTPCDLAGFYWPAIRRSRWDGAIRGGVFDAEPIDSPHRKIAVAPSRIAGWFRFGRPIRITSIGRTVKRLGCTDVSIHGPIRFTRSVMNDGHCTNVGADETADCSPVSMN